MRTWLAALAALVVGALVTGIMYVATAPYAFTSFPAPTLPADGIGWQSWSRVDGTHKLARVLVPTEYDRAVPAAANVLRNPAPREVMR